MLRGRPGGAFLDVLWLCVFCCGATPLWEGIWHIVCTSISLSTKPMLMQLSSSNVHGAPLQ